MGGGVVDNGDDGGRCTEARLLAVEDIGSRDYVTDNVTLMQSRARRVQAIKSLVDSDSEPPPQWPFPNPSTLRTS